MSTPTVHIISNVDVDLSECGLLLPLHPVCDPTPWPLPLGDLAIFDNDHSPAGSRMCPACTDAYHAQGA